MRHHRPLLFLLLLAALSSCGDNGGETTPLRHGFPRVRIYDSIYAAADSFPVHFEVNRQAGCRVPRAGWLDVAYPRYGAVLHISALACSGDRLASELDKRRERMSLNIYGFSARTEHLTSADSSFEAVMLVSHDAVSTPVQFVATDGQSVLVTGSAYMPGVRPESPADSIAPQVEALRRDVVHAIRQLRHD